MFAEYLLQVSTVLRAGGAGINKMNNILAFLLGDTNKERMTSTFPRWQTERCVARTSTAAAEVAGSWMYLEGRTSRVYSLVVMYGLHERGIQNEAQVWDLDSRTAECPSTQMGDTWEEWEGAHESASGPLMKMLKNHPREDIQ